MALKYRTAILSHENKVFPNVKFIFLTGETRVGKDTLALKIKKEYTGNRFNVQILPLAHELKSRYKLLYNKDPDEGKGKVDEYVIRQQLYDLSLLIKKTEGKSFFCRESVFKKINNDTNIVIVPDLRFMEEYEYFKENVKDMTVIKVLKKENPVGVPNKKDECYLNVYDTEKIPFDQTTTANF